MEGLWQDYRRDQQRTGRALLSGSGCRLTHRRTLQLSGGYQQMVPVPDGSGEFVMAMGGALQRVTRDMEQRWRSHPRGIHWITTVADLDGDGALEILTSNGREVLIYRAHDGVLVWSYSVGPPFSYGTYATMFQTARLLPNARGMQIVVPCFSRKNVLLFDCTPGAANTRLLHSLWMDDAYHPTIAIADVNGDGIDEIVIARLGGIYVFSPETGRMQSQTQWNTDAERRRNYGHFELVDLDNDGDLEAVIISNRVTRHIAVLDNERGTFRPLWDRFVEHIYPYDRTELRYTSNSVCDIDGDGRTEITVGTFGVDGETGWCVEVMDGITGAIKSKMPGVYLDGITEEEHPQLLIHGTNDRVGGYTGPTSAVRVDAGGTPVTHVVAEARTRWASMTVKTTARKAQFKPDVFARDNVHSLRSNDAGHVEPLLLRAVGGKIQVRTLNGGTLGGPDHAISARDARIMHVGEDATFLVTSRGDMFRLDDRETVPLGTAGIHLTTEAHLSARIGTTPVIAAGEKNMVAATVGDVHHLFVTSQRVQSHKTIEGRGRMGYDRVYDSPSLTNVDGSYYFAVVDDAASDHGRLTLYDADGNIAQRFDFRDLPSSAAGERVGIYDWQFFKHPRGRALWISYYRSASMNSEAGRAILLETGEELWRRESFGDGEFGRGFGPWSASSVYSLEPPCAAFCAKDTLVLLDLCSGQIIRAALLTDHTADRMKRDGIYKPQGLSTWSTIDDPFTAYGTPIAVDLDRDGEMEFIVAGCFGGFGVVRQDLSVLWWMVSHFGDVIYRLPGVGYFSSRENLQIAQSFSDGSLRILDAMTGETVATGNIAAISTDITSADLDGDGFDEMVTGTNDGRLLVLKVFDDSIRMVEEVATGLSTGSPVVTKHPGTGAITCSVAVGDGTLQEYTIS